MGYKDLPSKHWFHISNIAGTPAQVWIYGEIGGWGISAGDVVQQIASLNVAEIDVHISSPGGDVFDGIAITNALRDHPANVVVKVDALAASIASVIAQAGNKIIMGRNSTMMIHNASGFAMGEAGDLRKMADLLDSTTANIASIYAERAGGTAKQWLKVMAEETWYTAEEAVAANLADEVAPLPTERDAHQQAAKWDLTNYVHAPKLVEPPAMQHADNQPDPFVPDTLSATPEPDTLVETATWDPALFRTAIAASAPPDLAWDPDLVRNAITAVTNDFPAPEPVTTLAPTPVASFDPDIFTRAIREAQR